MTGISHGSCIKMVPGIFPEKMRISWHLYNYGQLHPVTARSGEMLLHFAINTENVPDCI